jgi:phenylacetate-CoA ligase
MTSPAEERAVQADWHARSRGGDLSRFDNLLDNEFSPLETQIARVTRSVGDVLAFAAENVPHYRAQFRAAGLDATAPNALRTLAALPVLTKADVQDKAAALCAERLPPGQTLAEPMSSSGTTGRPTRVQRGSWAAMVPVYLRQREYRWYRFDPALKFAYIRFAHHFSAKPDGSLLKDGETGTLPGWPYLREFFETGPHVMFNVTSPVERQIAFLRETRPDYLMSFAESLEHLAFAAGDARPAVSLKGLVSTSEQLTPGMRRRVETGFGAPVRQNYGLNEIGPVAPECEAGRFHVHTEHCWVEIVDGGGRAVAPGETGRLLVTALNNAAMPLLRYDTGDLAIAVAGDCPCGRRLPGFGGIVGRYSRIAFLPEGTLTIVGMLRETIETLPAAAMTGVRQFQIHQSRDSGFLLRVVSDAALPDPFRQSVNARWGGDPLAGNQALEIVRVDELARPSGGKFQVFTSDFMPAPDADAAS